MKFKNIFFLLFVLTLPCLAQFTEQELYEAYLAQDMQVWGQYVRQADWSKADKAERSRILNYSYGYIAFAVSEHEVDAEKLLATYKSRIDDAKGQVNEAERLTYLSSFYAYGINYNKMKLLAYGRESISQAQKAVEADANNPIALALQGNILFFCPKFFGGDKAEALEYLKRAEQQFIEQNLTTNNWNYRAVQLSIAQCLEKTGNKAGAISKCKAVLEQEPNFAYIRDTYLPQLEGRAVKGNGKDVSGSLSGMILD